MSKKIVLLFLAFLFLGIPMLAMIVPVYATTGWGLPTNVSNDPNHNDRQSVIAQDPINTGVWHVAWAKEMTLSDPNSWEIYYTNSTTLASPKRITNDQVYDWNPMIDMDSKGVVHIVWVREDFATTQSDIFYTNSTNWNIQINISRQYKGTRNWQPTLVVDKKSGEPHIAWVASGYSPTGGPTPERFGIAKVFQEPLCK